MRHSSIRRRRWSQGKQDCGNQPSVRWRDWPEKHSGSELRWSIFI